MNGTGVLKVYLIQSKRYAFRLRFVHAKAPEWVLQALKDINPDATVGFDREGDENGVKLQRIIGEIKSQVH
jgi:hypothetical protein